MTHIQTSRARVQALQWLAGRVSGLGAEEKGLHSQGWIGNMDSVRARSYSSLPPQRGVFPATRSCCCCCAALVLLRRYLWEQKPLSCLGLCVVCIHVTEWIWECDKCWGQHQLGGRVCSSELLWDSTATLFLFWWVALGSWSWPVQLPLSMCRAGVVTVLALVFTSWVSQSNPLDWATC